MSAIATTIDLVPFDRGAIEILAQVAWFHCPIAKDTLRLHREWARTSTTENPSVWLVGQLKDQLILRGTGHRISKDQHGNLHLLWAPHAIPKRVYFDLWDEPSSHVAAPKRSKPKLGETPDYMKGWQGAREITQVGVWMWNTWCPIPCVQGSRKSVPMNLLSNGAKGTPRTNATRGSTGNAPTAPPAS